MAKGKIEIDKELCKSCLYCINTCPLKILRISEHVNVKGYQYAEQIDPEKCTGCAMCATMCPEAAIEVWR